jgi:Glycosyltransferase family 9 (heptosyltransferase)
MRDLRDFIEDCVDSVPACRARAQAVRADSANPLPLYRLSNLCRRRGRLDLWREGVDTALTFDHCTPEQRMRRSNAKLTLGDWSGWSDFEARHAKPTAHASDVDRMLIFSREVWDGDESLRGKTLLVVAEQGCGDTIQMMRYISQVANDATRVHVAVQSELVELAAYNFNGSADVWRAGVEYPDDIDRYVWLMSLPSIVGDLPPFTRLRAPIISTCQRSADALRLGLCWAGNPKHPNDAARSMPLTALARLLERNDLELHNLYVGPRWIEAAPYKNLQNPTPPFRTFADTAALIATMDAVVTVDTAVCHLSGSLAIPTLLLVPYESEWRWGLAETTPWYPTVRICRQPTPGDWDGAVDQLWHHLERTQRSDVMNAGS